MLTLPVTLSKIATESGTTYERYHVLTNETSAGVITIYPDVNDNAYLVEYETFTTTDNNDLDRYVYRALNKGFREANKDLTVIVNRTNTGTVSLLGSLFPYVAPTSNDTAPDELLYNLSDADTAQTLRHERPFITAIRKIVETPVH